MPLDPKQAVKAAPNKDVAEDADDAAAVLAKMQAKEDNGDCAFC